MPSSPRELLDAFCEVEMIGSELADSITKWAQDNLSDDELADLPSITQDLSGESAASRFTEIGVPEPVVASMLLDLGFSPESESDDRIESPFEVKRPKVVSERLNAFLAKCVEVSAPLLGFVKEVEVKTLEDGSREEVRIVLNAASDLRRLPPASPDKQKFMEYLRDLRSHASRFSMIDEAFCFNPRTSEFIISLKHYGSPSKDDLADDAF